MEGSANPFATCYRPVRGGVSPQLRYVADTALRVVEAFWSLRAEGVRLLRWRNGPILVQYRGVNAFTHLVKRPRGLEWEWGIWKGSTDKPDLLPVVALRQWPKGDGALVGGVRGVSPERTDDLPTAVPRILRYIVSNLDRIPRTLPARMAMGGESLHVGHYLAPALYVLLEPVVLGYDKRVPGEFCNPSMKLIAVGVRAEAAIRATVRGTAVPPVLRLNRITFVRRPFSYRVGSGESDCFEIRLCRRDERDWGGETKGFPVVLPEPGVYMVEADLESWSPQWVVCQRELDGSRIGQGWRDLDPPNHWHGPLMALDPMAAWQVQMNRAIRSLTWILVLTGTVSIIATVVASNWAGFSTWAHRTWSAVWTGIQSVLSALRFR